MKFCSFGSLNMDHVYRLDAFILPGETKSARTLHHVCGGKGLNQSIALSAGGGSVWHAGNVGDNQEGASLIKTLFDRGVDTRFVRRLAGVDCGHAVIQVTDKGENCILLFDGANNGVDNAQMDDVLSHFGKGDMLVAQNEINDLYPLFQKARARGLAIAFNPSPVNAKITPELLALCDILFVNEVEAGLLSGTPFADERAGAALKEKYPAAMVVQTLGKHGAVVFEGSHTYRQTAFLVKAVDTTAAGDTFTGYFLSGIAAGSTIPDCLLRATKASALCVSRSGASVSIPDLAQVDAFTPPD